MEQLLDEFAAYLQAQDLSANTVGAFFACSRRRSVRTSRRWRSPRSTCRSTATT